jgi:hypothetical protein
MNVPGTFLKISWIFQSFTRDRPMSSGDFQGFARDLESHREMPGERLQADLAIRFLMLHANSHSAAGAALLQKTPI